MGKILALALLFLAGGLQAAPQPGPGARKTRLIVGFKPGIAAERKAAILKDHGMRLVEDIDLLSATVVESAGGKVHPNSMRLMGNADVAVVEEDFFTHWLVGEPVSLRQVPLPALGSVMGGLPRFVKSDASEGELPWGVNRLRAQDAWSVTEGQGVKVAVIDTGIDFKHPDLAPNYAGGYNAIDSDKEPMDDNMHGTHVAGTIAAVRDGKGVVGVAPKARLYAVKVLDKDGSGWLTSIIKGLVWTGRNGMQVANMSLGAPMGSIFMHLAVKYAKSKGVVIIAAAGNSGGSVSYPGAYKETLAVAAMDSNNGLADFSSRGPEVDFIAPGVDVNSTLPGGRYGRFSGTSMATPHVAGLAALAVTQGAKDLASVQQFLQKASEKLDGLKPEEQGAGVPNAGRLVQ